MNPIVDGVTGNAIWAAIVRFILLPAYATVRTFTKHSPFKSVVLCLNYRDNTRTKYYAQAFASGTDVLCLDHVPGHLESDGAALDY